jgi:hypothetical protein
MVEWHRTAGEETVVMERGDDIPIEVGPEGTSPSRAFP